MSFESPETIIDEAFSDRIFGDGNDIQLEVASQYTDTAIAAQPEARARAAALTEVELLSATVDLNADKPGQDTGQDPEKPGPDRAEEISNPEPAADDAGSGDSGDSGADRLGSPEEDPRFARPGHHITFVGEPLDEITKNEILHYLEARKSETTDANYIGEHIAMTEKRISQLHALRQATVDYAQSLGVDVRRTALHPNQFTFFTPKQYRDFMARNRLGEREDYGMYSPVLDHALIVQRLVEGFTLGAAQHESGHGASYTNRIFYHYKINNQDDDYVPVLHQIGLQITERDTAAPEGLNADTYLGKAPNDTIRNKMLNEFVEQSKTLATIDQEWHKHPELAFHVGAATDAGHYSGLVKVGKEFREYQVMNTGNELVKVLAGKFETTAEIMARRLHRAQLMGDVDNVEAILEVALGPEGSAMVEQWQDPFDDSLLQYLRSIQQS